MSEDRAAMHSEPPSPRWRPFWHGVEWTAIVPHILVALSTVTAFAIPGREINHDITAIEA